MAGKSIVAGRKGARCNFQSGPSFAVLLLLAVLAAAAGTAVWSFRLDTTPLENGWHTLHARSFDGREYSGTAGIELQSQNAATSGESLGFAVCALVIIALVLVLVAAFLHYLSKTGQDGRPAAGGAPIPGRTLPPHPWSTDQAGRAMPYPSMDSPYYRPSAAGVPYRDPAPPRLHYQGGMQAPTEAFLVSPEEGAAFPPPPVGEHERAPAGASGGPDIEEAMVPDAEIDLITVTEVAEGPEEPPTEALEVVDMEAGSPPETPAYLPRGQSGPAAPPSASSGRDRRERVRRALAAMPRGIPLPLLGITLDELAGMILSAPRQTVPGGPPVVRLKGRWYRADEDNLKDFMVEYKP